jgi:hypothetical protein
MTVSFGCGLITVYHRAGHQTLTTLGLDGHPDKTFIGGSSAASTSSAIT